MKFKELYEGNYEYIRKASTLPTGKMISVTDNRERIGIMFRSSASPSTTWANSGTYYWNAFGDGWFRSMEGVSKGYGLIFKNLKLTSKNPISWDGKQKYIGALDGRTTLFKATFEYVPSEFTNEYDWDKKYEKEPIWLIVPEDVDPQDAINLVMKDQKKWTP